MAVAQRLSNEPSQITLQLQLSVHYGKSSYGLGGNDADNHEYRICGNSSWKLAVSLVSSNSTQVELYCRRNSSKDTMLAVYDIRLKTAGYGDNNNCENCYTNRNNHSHGYSHGYSYNNGYSNNYDNNLRNYDSNFHNDYNYLRDFHQQGHAIFSGPMLETNAEIDFNYTGFQQYGLQQFIQKHTKPVYLQMHITILNPFAEDAHRMKIYEDVFSSDDKTQLFSPSSPYPSDCVITLKDNKQVHVNKTVLSLNSEYFKAMFDTDNAGSVTLDTIECEDFVELLSVIYPSGHPITAKNVETLSKLGSEFKMPDLLKRCDVFLMVSSENFGKAKLLLMAQDYGLKRLQTKVVRADKKYIMELEYRGIDLSFKLPPRISITAQKTAVLLSEKKEKADIAHFIREYKSIEDVKAIKKEPEYASLNYQTRRMFLDNIIEANAPSVPHVSSMSKCNPISQKAKMSVGPEAKQAREAEILEELASLTFCAPDMVLVVGDKRIQAHKQLLSIYSQYFNTMLQSEFKEGRENEIVLEEVDFEEILELLAVIYPSDNTISESNIGTILKLADRFIMPAIVARCAKKLKKMNNINGALKLWYAQRYNLINLQEEFAHNCKNIADVMKLKAKPEFDLLDDKTRALILDSITQQNNEVRVIKI